MKQTKRKGAKNQSKNEKSIDYVDLLNESNDSAKKKSKPRRQVSKPKASKKGGRRANSESKSKVSISNSEQENILAVLEEDDYIEIDDAIQVPLDIGLNASADFFLGTQKNNAKSESNLEENLEDLLLELQEVGNDFAEYSNFGGDNCCLAGGDSSSEKAKKGATKKKSDNGQIKGKKKEEAALNLDEAINKALGQQNEDWEVPDYIEEQQKSQPDLQ